jgi:LuxR family transcriptional regulator, maltose regulon positive regulatory protein
VTTTRPPARQAAGQTPRLPSNLVDRPRLLTALDAPAPLVLLRAPVGYGKTTVAAQWAAAQDHRALHVVWVRVTPDADTADGFWSHLCRVLLDDGVGTADATDVTAPPHLVAESLLRSADMPVAIVVDDDHGVTAGGLDAALLDLVRDLPHLRLVACVRDQGAFDEHLRVDLDTTVLTSADLRFTAEEISALMSGAGVELTPDVAHYLAEESGGWPEPLRTGALRMREMTRVTTEVVVDVVHAVANEYLLRRLVPSDYPAERVAFALLTCIPDSFTVDLAEALTDDPRTAEHVAEFVSDGMLTGEDGPGGRHYRWPPAARRSLNDGLRARWPDRVPELHARLAAWYAAADRIDLALWHATEAHDWSRVTDIIDAAWRRLLAGPNDVLYRALLELPLEEARRSPRVLAVRDAKLRVPDDFVLDASRLPSDPDDLRAIGRRDNAADVVDTGLALLMALRRRGAFDRASGYADRLLQITEAAHEAHPSDVAPLSPIVQLQAGVTLMLAGDLSSAILPIKTAYDQAQLNPEAHVDAEAAGRLALLLAMIGVNPEARVWLEHGPPAGEVGDSRFLPRGRAACDAARLLLASDALDLAAAAAANADLIRQTGRDEFWAFHLCARAQYALVNGTAADMLDHLDRGRRIHHEWLGRGAVAPSLLAVTEADLHLALGRGNLAEATLDTVPADVPAARVPRARLALLSGRPEAALQLSYDSAWERAASARNRLELTLIRAVAAHRLGETGTAQPAIRRAIDTARATDRISAFATVPRDDLELLADAAPELTWLLTEPRLAAQREIFPAEVTHIDLTEREREVLADLADGLTVQEIADKSVLSYNTVRTQQRSLYRKLGTSDRAEVIALARRWGLLSPTG